MCDRCAHLQFENDALRRENTQQTTIAASALARADRFQLALRRFAGEAYLEVLRTIVANERAALARERRLAS